MKDGFVFSMLSYFVIVFWLTFSKPLLLCAAVTIMVKKRLVNSITFFIYFVGSGSAALAAWRQRWQQGQQGSGGQLCSGGSSLAEAQF